MQIDQFALVKTANYLQEKQHKREHATPAVQRIHVRDLGR